MTRFGTGLTVLVAFACGAAADRGYRHLREPSGPYAHMSHVGVLVPDMDQAVAEFRGLGFKNISISPANKGIDRRYHNAPLDCSLKQAFVKGVPQIELLQPVCDTPNPWASELKEHGMQLHHLAFYVRDAPAELEKVKQLGFMEISEGKWRDDEPGFGEFFYVRKPGDALIVEFLTHTKS